MQNVATYECPECGLHYTDEATAKKCEAFCREHHACSLEIAQQSIEASQATTLEPPEPDKT